MSDVIKTVRAVVKERLLFHECLHDAITRTDGPSDLDEIVSDVAHAIVATVLAAAEYEVDAALENGTPRYGWSA
jgi:hypothetical protein